MMLLFARGGGTTVRADCWVCILTARKGRMRRKAVERKKAPWLGALALPHAPRHLSPTPAPCRVWFRLRVVRVSFKFSYFWQKQRKSRHVQARRTLSHHCSVSSISPLHVDSDLQVLEAVDHLFFPDVVTRPRDAGALVRPRMRFGRRRRRSNAHSRRLPNRP